jgi:hypothetical protein
MLSTTQRNADYLYTLQPWPYDYYSGSIPGGSQVLIATACPSFVYLLFDSHGNYIEKKVIYWSSHARAIAETEGIHAASCGPLREEVAFLQQSIDLLEDAIHIKKFFIPELFIGIKDFPDYFYSILMDPPSYSPDEIVLAQTEFTRWSSEGLFELWLNQEEHLWIDRSGQVVSS